VRKALTRQRPRRSAPAATSAGRTKAHHILIKRPLLIIGKKKIVGFDVEKIAKLIGINKEAHTSIEMMIVDISKGCPNKKKKGVFVVLLVMFIMP